MGQMDRVQEELDGARDAAEVLLRRNNAGRTCRHEQFIFTGDEGDKEEAIAEFREKADEMEMDADDLEDIMESVILDSGCLACDEEKGFDEDNDHEE